jgi:dihydropteroate synthase
MIYKTLDTSIENANGTILNFGIDQRSQNFKVHDVKEAMECVTLFNKINL